MKFEIEFEKVCYAALIGLAFFTVYLLHLSAFDAREKTNERMKMCVDAGFQKELPNVPAKRWVGCSP